MALSRTKVQSALAILLAAIPGLAGARALPASYAPPPPPECSAPVGYDRDVELPGYLIPTEKGAPVCVPFTVTATRPPAGYSGDFYVNEFTDAKLKERWEACKKEASCLERLSRHIARRKPPNREHGITDPTARYLLGKIDADNPDVDLRTIRRPTFFSQPPNEESIAEADAHTFTVEFTVPPEPYERLQLHMTKDIKLRGWYLRGGGVTDGSRRRPIRSLIIMSSGGGGRLVAIEDPHDHLYHLDPDTGKSVVNSFPNATTGASGQRAWRQYLYTLNLAGFDVLSYDRRGVGVSGGFSDTNTLQQGRDILQVISELGNGVGVRVLTPAGVELRGQVATRALLGEARADRMPILLGGSSRGTMATGWAMTRNFERTCDYDLASAACGPAVGLRNIRGALMLADFSAGVGYLTTQTTQEDADRGLFLAGTEAEYGIVFFPASQVLAGMRHWPAVFIARGLWDYAESLEGAIAAYNRVSGLKELVVVRGPHPLETWPAQEQERVAQRLVEFARAVVLDYRRVPGGRAWSNMKELVATASDVWEPSSEPRNSH